MRLSSLKLAGFKSFADSTTLHFSANRTAVVGPNGCGKSNVIDAIRWVMGESSARQLRGGRMQDVIFTGTAKRKPVGMASVELRFDNTYGKLGGMYNAYTELAVRRQVNRDGKSEYFLNGTKCRRRDITDIFLGTGLGPRSYAIIEQGMISRLVDAKPEELRVYIEEAAGVSRYQARRRESLTHLEHTTHNLARLEDLQLELHAQLKMLKRQAKAALQYQQLESDIRALKIAVLSFQYSQSMQLQQEHSQQVHKLSEHFQNIRSALTTVEHALTASTDLFEHLLQQSTPLQQDWQTAEQKLSELKSQSEHKQKILQQNQTTLVQLHQQKMQAEHALQQLKQQQQTLSEQYQQQQNQQYQTEQTYTVTQQHCIDLKVQQQQLSQQFDAVKHQVELQQQQQLQIANQISQLQKNIARQQQQQALLKQQQHALLQQQTNLEIEHLHNEQQAIAVQLTQLREQVRTTENQKMHLDVKQQNLQQQCQHLENQIQLLLGERQQLLKTVPKASGAVQGTVLTQTLQLQPQAKVYVSLLEKLLAQWLNSQVLEEQQHFAPNQARQIKPKAVPSIQIADLEPLSNWIITPQHSLWAQVAIAQDLRQALALQQQLQSGQSILSLDGYHIGTDWLIALEYDQHSQTDQASLSQRLRLEEIAQQLVILEPELQQLQQSYQQNSAELMQTKHSLQQQQTALNTDLQQQQQLELEIVKCQTSLQASTLQQQQLLQHLQQVTNQVDEDLLQLNDLNIDLHAITFKLEHIQPEYRALQSQFEQVCSSLGMAEQKLLEQQQQVYAVVRQKDELQQQIELLNKDHSFLTVQLSQVDTQMQQSSHCIEASGFELEQLTVQIIDQQYLASTLQEQWQSWQQQLNQVQSNQQQLTQTRQQNQQQHEQLSQQLEQQRLAWHTAKSDAVYYATQLREIGAQPQQVEQQFNLAEKQQLLEQIQQQFSKLGAVNLTASMEYQALEQRSMELDHQIQDLKHTVEQLQAAMQSIDQETRKLFMQTFDQINSELKQLFPKVFNGGEAALSLEGDWQSGVKLVARPPGKRNSSLALLSGGEKALTTLALVFAIFRLNPAPFCVLDEVDAPLDDANVGRFCNLVKELSEQVQFIYISHNKLAMTMATDLLGVTMPEAGTSKLVTVNLEQAEQYLVAES